MMLLIWRLLDQCVCACSKLAINVKAARRCNDSKANFRVRVQLMLLMLLLLTMSKVG